LLVPLRLVDCVQAKRILFQYKNLLRNLSGFAKIGFGSLMLGSEKHASISAHVQMNSCAVIWGKKAPNCRRRNLLFKCAICACTKITGSYGPILVMIVAAGFFVAGVGCSLALIIRELRKAPEGYEDENGFHTVRNGVVKYGVPDSMKARRTRSSLNWAMHPTLRIKAFRVRGLPFFGKRVPHAASEFSATSRRRAGSYR
jgi:hypothetical protein